MIVALRSNGDGLQFIRNCGTQEDSKHVLEMLVLPMLLL
jgi:hypothetical protein